MTVCLRTIYNLAANSKITDKKNYPFGTGKVAITFPDSIKIGLTESEVKIIEGLELTDYTAHARNVWLVSFYFAGMRLSDVLRLKWADCKDERLYYAMGKNLKAGSLKTPEKAMAILEKYHQGEPKHGFIFPELKALDEISAV